MSDKHLNQQDIDLINATIEDHLSKNKKINTELVYAAVATKLHVSMFLHVFRPLMSEGFRNGSFPGFTTKLGRGGGIIRGDGVAKVVKPVEIVSSTVMKTYASAPIVEPEFDAKKELALQALEDAKELALQEAETAKALKSFNEAQSLIAAGVSSNLLKADKPYLSVVPKTVKTEPLKNSLYEPGAMFYLTIGEERYKVPCAQAYVQSLLTNVFNASEDVNGNVEFCGKRYLVENTSMLEGLLLWFLNCSIVRGVVKKEI